MLCYSVLIFEPGQREEKVSLVLQVWAKPWPGAEAFEEPLDASLWLELLLCALNHRDFCLEVGMLEVLGCLSISEQLPPHVRLLGFLMDAVGVVDLGLASNGVPVNRLNARDNELNLGLLLL